MVWGEEHFAILETLKVCFGTFCNIFSTLPFKNALLKREKYPVPPPPPPPVPTTLLKISYY